MNSDKWYFADIHETCGEHLSGQKSLGSGFGRTDFSRIFFLGRRIFSRIFSPDFFSSFLWEKKRPEKSSRKIPAKILQNLYNKNPRHISAEGPGQKSCRTKVPPFFFCFFVPNFAPNFYSEFSPNFWRSFRALFRGKRRPEKLHQKSPPFFSMQNSQANSKRKSTKVFLESGQFAAIWRTKSADITPSFFRKSSHRTKQSPQSPRAL